MQQNNRSRSTSQSGKPRSSKNSSFRSSDSSDRFYRSQDRKTSSGSGSGKPYRRSYSDSKENNDRNGDSFSANRPASGRGFPGKRYNSSPERKDFRREPARKPEQDSIRPKKEFSDEEPFLVLGRNAVREALRSEKSINKILVVKDHDGSLGELVTLAKEKKVQVQTVERRKLDELCLPFGHGGKPGNHQGVVAYVAGVEYCEVADILREAKNRGEDPFVIVLDGIEDPHNLGSIIRSAECAGAHGVIIGKRRSASVTASAVKASAGATEHMLISRVVNISGAIEELKRANLWIAGADMSGVLMTEQGLNGPLALVIGNEGSGLSQLVKNNCDFLVSIPMHGKIDSLNAGVAAGILMFEKVRQDSLSK